MSDIIYTPPATAGTTGIGVAGQVTFWSAATVLSGDNGLFWDNTNKRLGIGTITPTHNIQVVGNAIVENNANTSAAFTSRNGATNGIAASFPTPNGGSVQFQNGYIESAAVQFRISTNSAVPFVFMTQGTERMRLAPTTGNILIGTTTDAGYKFDVNGTSIFRGTTEHNADVGLNGNRLYIGSLFGNTVLRPISTNLQLLNSNTGAALYLNANGSVQLGQSNVITWASFSATGHTIVGTTNTYFFSNGNVSINQSVDAGYKFQVNGNAYINSTLYLGNARVGFSQSVPYFDIVASFAGGSGFSIGFVDNNNTNRWATWKYNGSAMSDYTSTPTPVNGSVQFQLDSISRGFLLARMTDAQILAIASPATGIMVYSTSQNHIAYFDGTVWKKLNNSNL